MENNKIVCPNCGAENKYGGTCEYCGTTLLQNSYNHIASESENESRPNYLNEDGYQYFKESFDPIDKITQTCTPALELDDCDRVFTYLCRERSLTNEQVYIVYRIPCSPCIIVSVLPFCQLTPSQAYLLQTQVGHDWGVSYYSGNPTTLAFNLNQKHYKINHARIKRIHKHDWELVRYIRFNFEYDEWIIYYPIDRNILNEICELSYSSDLFDAKISFDDHKSLTLRFEEIRLLKIIQDARLLFNRVYDNSAYADNLTAFQKESDEIKKKEEEERIKREQEREREKVEREKELALEQQARIKAQKQYEIKGWIYKIGMVISVLLIIKGVHHMPWDLTSLGIGLLIGIVCFLAWLNWVDDINMR